MTICSPSRPMWAVSCARALAKQLGAELAIIDKRRPQPNETEVMNVIGETKERTCMIIDDIVDTAGTLCKAAHALKQRGARRDFAAATHQVLSGDAIRRIIASELDELIVTDTIALREDARHCQKIRQLSSATLFAETFSRICYGGSL